MFLAWVEAGGLGGGGARRSFVLRQCPNSNHWYLQRFASSHNMVRKDMEQDTL